MPLITIKFIKITIFTYKMIIKKSEGNLDWELQLSSVLNKSNLLVNMHN